MAKTHDRLKQRYGPWAVVTGASDGIGRAFATQLASAGISVAVVARRGERLEQLADQLRADHAVDAVVLAGDLRDREFREVVNVATDQLDVGLLVAAAGFGSSGPLISTELERELAMVELNCQALLAHTHHFARRFAQQGRGGLILLSSLVGFQGVPRAANYASTKAYVQTLAEAVHRELKPAGVDVLACAPGPVRSGFAAAADMQLGATVAPEEVARGALAALGRHSTVAPGALSRLLTVSLRPLPRAGRVRVMERVMTSMTRHQRAATTDEHA